MNHHKKPDHAGAQWLESRFIEASLQLTQQPAEYPHDIDHQQTESVALLDQMHYYRANMTRQEAKKVCSFINSNFNCQILNEKETGSFLVRRHTSNPMWFSLSFKTADYGVLHMVISDQTTSDGRIYWQLGMGGSSHLFSSVPVLITYYQCNPLDVKSTEDYQGHSTILRKYT